MLLVLLAPMVLLPLAGEGLLSPIGSFQAKSEMKDYLEENHTEETLRISYPRENIKSGAFYATVKNMEGELVYNLTFDPDTNTVREESL